MKKNIIITLALILILGTVGCSANHDLKVVNTFSPTESDLIEEFFDDSKEVVSKEYHEMSDGTWVCGEYTYKYKLLVTGRLNNAENDITYTILSNIEDITFEQAWKASGLSSNLDDYYKEEDAVFVATVMRGDI